MSEMVERVAASICRQDADNDGFLEWTNCGDKERWRNLARAAIPAMREPSEAMWRAAESAIDEFSSESPAGQYYRAMIDSALTPSHQE